MTATAEAPVLSAELEQLAAISEQRAATYNLLARLFQVEVDQPLLDELKARAFPTGTGNEAVDAGYGLIASFMSNLWENSLLDLAIDYVRVFIGHGLDMYSAAYPYESVYTSKKRLLMQEARDEVLAIYRSHKLDKADAWAESEDHLSAELEFMQVLCDRAAACLTSGDEDGAIAYLTTQRNFLEDHLVCWVPMLCQDMKRFAKTDFYRGLAFLTDGFLQTDFEFLSYLLSEDSDDEASAADAAPGANAAADDSTAAR